MVSGNQYQRQPDVEMEQVDNQNYQSKNTESGNMREDPLASENPLARQPS